MKTKLVVGVLLAVCFTLAGALYATAAPSSVPGQIYSLKVKVKVLRLRLDAVTEKLSEVACESQDTTRRLIDIIYHGIPADPPMDIVRVCQTR